jgi:hypothetical protein
VVLELRGERILPLGVSITKGLNADPLASLFSEAVFLIKEAQDSAVGAAKLGELVDILGDSRRFPPFESEAEVGLDERGENRDVVGIAGHHSSPVPFKPRGSFPSSFFFESTNSLIDAIEPAFGPNRSEDGDHRATP